MISLKHKTTADAAHASADAVLHGTDLECGQNIYVKLVDAVKQGLITEAQIDESVAFMTGSVWAF